jgi:hypothetical protein
MYDALVKIEILPAEAERLCKSQPVRKAHEYQGSVAESPSSFRAASIKHSTSFGVRCSRSRGRRIGPELVTFRLTPSGDALGMAGTHSVLRDCHPAQFVLGAFCEMFGPAAGPRCVVALSIGDPVRRWLG